MLWPGRHIRPVSSHTSDPPVSNLPSFLSSLPRLFLFLLLLFLFLLLLLRARGSGKPRSRALLARPALFLVRARARAPCARGPPRLIPSRAFPWLVSVPSSLLASPVWSNQVRTRFLRVVARKWLAWRTLLCLKPMSCVRSLSVSFLICTHLFPFWTTRGYPFLSLSLFLAGARYVSKSRPSCVILWRSTFNFLPSSLNPACGGRRRCQYHTLPSFQHPPP